MTTDQTKDTILARALKALALFMLGAAIACFSYSWGYWAGAQPHIPLDYVQVLMDMTSEQGWAPNSRLRVRVPPTAAAGWSRDQDAMAFEFSETQRPTVEVQIPVLGPREIPLTGALIQDDKFRLELQGVPDIVVPIH